MATIAPDQTLRVRRGRLCEDCTSHLRISRRPLSVSLTKERRPSPMSFSRKRRPLSSSTDSQRRIVVAGTPEPRQTLDVGKRTPRCSAMVMSSRISQAGSAKMRLPAKIASRALRRSYSSSASLAQSSWTTTSWLSGFSPSAGSGVNRPSYRASRALIRSACSHRSASADSRSAVAGVRAASTDCSGPLHWRYWPPFRVSPKSKGRSVIMLHGPV